MASLANEAERVMESGKGEGRGGRGKLRSSHPFQTQQQNVVQGAGSLANGQQVCNSVSLAGDQQCLDGFFSGGDGVTGTH